MSERTNTETGTEGSTTSVTDETGGVSSGEPSENASADRSGSNGERVVREPNEDRVVRERLLKGVLVLLGFVALIATFQFYTSASAAIDRWVAREYRPVFQAAFNLVVLLVAGAGISLVLQELATE